MEKRTLGKIDSTIFLLLRWSSILCLFGLLCLVAAGVFVRFVPVSSMGWGDEIIEMGFAWMVFLGAAALWRGRSHFRVEVLPMRLAGSKAGRMLEAVLSLICLLFLVVFTYESSLLTLQATDRSPFLEITRIYFYLVLPISGAIMIGYTLRDLWLLFRGKFLAR
jgi:TRAP-type C4-dicarboxylate transport system permease small subunit